MSEKSSPKLERVLNIWEVLALAVGAMIGMGWIVLTDDFVNLGGTAGGMVAFLIVGVVVLFVGLTYSELASAMPFVGGEHVYTYRAMGDIGSFSFTWMIVLGYATIVAFEAVAFPAVLENLALTTGIGDIRFGYLWTVAGYDVHLSSVLIGSLLSIAIWWVNIQGVEMAANIQTVVTAFIVIAGAALIIGAPINGSMANAEPLFKGVDGLMLVIVMLPGLFVGFDVIPQAAEEINLPPKRIGEVLLMSVAASVIFYALLVFAVGMSLTPEALTKADMGTVDAAEVALGGVHGRYLLLIAGLAGIITSWNAFMVGGSRAIYALAHSNMLPKGLAKIHPEHNTPVNAIMVLGVLATVAPLFGRPLLVWLVNAGSFSIVVAYIGVAASWIILRRSAPEMARPFLAGRSELVGWVAVLSSIAIASLYMPGMQSALGMEEWLIVAVWIVVGAGMYIWSRDSYGLADPHTIYQKEPTPSQPQTTS